MNTRDATGIRAFLNKRVLVISGKSGARYAGVLSGFKENGCKFCISNLAIINKAGDYIVSGLPESRWFSTALNVVLEE